MPDTLRAHAAKLRGRAQTSEHAVERHLLVVAARHYDGAADRLHRAVRVERDALRYGRDPGGGDLTPPRE